MRNTEQANSESLLLGKCILPVSPPCGFLALHVVSCLGSQEVSGPDHAVSAEPTKPLMPCNIRGCLLLVGPLTDTSLSSLQRKDHSSRVVCSAKGAPQCCLASVYFLHSGSWSLHRLGPGPRRHHTPCPSPEGCRLRLLLPPHSSGPRSSALRLGQPTQRARSITPLILAGRYSITKQTRLRLEVHRLRGSARRL
ncbi:hypothetical protein NDU88_003080 [Pleurodeles waltl]|uniref:Uncharacterized protein n=1 Tax=Pleurodeles waltl TaxID=8319 RepID=A0AAV7RDU7_PLEWA|nr:hypothetical protein NDU88_003080 [Pleurodeles waltl]